MGMSTYSELVRVDTGKVKKDATISLYLRMTKI